MHQNILAMKASMCPLCYKSVFDVFMNEYCMSDLNTLSCVSLFRPGKWSLRLIRPFRGSVGSAVTSEFQVMVAQKRYKGAFI